MVSFNKTNSVMILDMYVDNHNSFFSTRLPMQIQIKI
jgi:hypothetical protein